MALLPSHKETDLAILQALYELGGKRRREEVIPRVIQILEAKGFDLSGAKARILKDSYTTSLNKHIDYRRLALRQKGEVKGDKRGVWEISAEGIERLKQEGRLPPVPPIPPTSIPTFVPIPGPAGLPGPPGPGILELLEKQQREIREQLHQRILALTPQQFEKFVGEFLKSQGATDIKITGRIGDEGIDGEAKLKSGILETPIAFQAKRWREQNVGRSHIDQFRGAIQERFNQGIFITTSDFSDDAKQSAIRPGAIPIQLINGKLLIEQCLKSGLGIKSEPLVIIKVNEDFFTSLG